MRERMNENELYWPGVFMHTRSVLYSDSATGQDTDNTKT